MCRMPNTVIRMQIESVQCRVPQRDPPKRDRNRYEKKGHGRIWHETSRYSASSHDHPTCAQTPVELPRRGIAVLILSEGNCGPDDCTSETDADNLCSANAWNKRYDARERVESDHVEEEMREGDVRESRGDRSPIAAFFDVLDANGEVLVHLLEELRILFELGILPCSEDDGVEADDCPQGA